MGNKEGGEWTKGRGRQGKEGDKEGEGREYGIKKGESRQRVEEGKGQGWVGEKEGSGDKGKSGERIEEGKGRKIRKGEGME